MLGGHRTKFYAIAAVALGVGRPASRRQRRRDGRAPAGLALDAPDQGNITQPLTRIVVSSGPIHRG